MVCAAHSACPASFLATQWYPPESSFRTNRNDWRGTETLNYCQACLEPIIPLPTPSPPNSDLHPKALPICLSGSPTCRSLCSACTKSSRTVGCSWGPGESPLGSETSGTVTSGSPRPQSSVDPLGDPQAPPGAPHTWVPLVALQPHTHKPQLN